MSSSSSYSPEGIPFTAIFSTAQKRLFLGFCAFWLFVALLELGQDYISAALDGNSFMIWESLSYKVFWLLFIPLSISLDFSYSKAGNFISGIPYYILSAILILFATLIHLTVFSLILFGISNLIHEDPVTLLYLLYEKLSTRLYIALSVYTVLSVLYLLFRRRSSRKKKKQPAAPSTITVKNGTNTVLVDVDDIKWISSDGAYLDIHTASKKHVVLDSLKNIINQLPDNFKRIHKSTIANINCIRELKSRGNGDYDVVMDNEAVLRLSRNYTKQLKGVLL